MAPRTLTVIGGGWAGLAAAVAASDAGWRVTVLEAAPHWGGRARRLPPDDRHGNGAALDNGQHILIGAYTATLRLMRRLGVDLEAVLQRMPLALPYPDGSGLALPRWADRLPGRLAPWGLGAALLSVRGWSVGERWAMLRAAARWQRHGFACAATAAVADLCAGLPPRVVAELIEPLCVAALNTPMAQASGAVFLRVLRDALLGEAVPPFAPSDLLIPRVDLGQLLPDPATAALRRAGAHVLTGARAIALARAPDRRGWRITLGSGRVVESTAVILACPAWEAARLLATVRGPAGEGPDGVALWIEQARALTHTPIATVYLDPPTGWHWPAATPMLALRADGRGGPAQFVFRRAAPMDGRDGLAFVASAPPLASDRLALTEAVRVQAASALGLHGGTVRQTVVEKRATFACTPGLRRPAARIADGLIAAGDYVAGPYPATLEGAVRSGLAAAAALTPAAPSPPP
ncbi:hydroxysqualene dehydroxylase HpnE [Tepidimonas sp.]|uniref:hydroxysqualene dehydroxylase HpnE n=1 Tax=Tepidimonas sp. TaxID=2002775 RepID=UPI003919AEF1